MVVRRIGLDLALKAPHRAVIYDDGERVGGAFPVERTKEGLEHLLARATAGTSGPCEFVMEPTGLAWVVLAAELERRGHRVFVPKPQKTHALRKFLAEHTKTDTTDACAQALVRHVDQRGVHELHTARPEQTTLKMFVKRRAQLVAQAGKCKQRIKSWLVMSHPGLAEAFGDSLFGKPGRALLRSRHFDPSYVKKRGKARLKRFLGRHEGSNLVDDVWDASCQASGLVEALRAEQKLPFDFEGQQLLVRGELDLMEFLERQVGDLEKRIRTLYRQLDPKCTLVEQVPGIGVTIAAALESFVGPIRRFRNIKKFVSFVGLAPRTNLTAGDEKPGQRMSKAGPNLLKQYLFLAAETARRYDPELAASYAKAIDRGKHHYCAANIVAHKLARRIYAILRQRDAQAASEVSYRLRDPDSGESLTRKTARELVLERYPSKKVRAAQQRQSEATTQPAPPSSGSSKDATKGARARRRPAE